MMDVPTRSNIDESVVADAVQGKQPENNLSSKNHGIRRRIRPRSTIRHTA
jgi:hypothetical protein